MKRKILALCTSAALALGLVAVGVATAAPASAHTPNVSATCDALSVNLTNYAASQPGKDAVPAVYQDIPHHDLVTPAQDAVPEKVTITKYVWTGGSQDTAPVWPGPSWNATGDTHPNHNAQIGVVYQQGQGDNASWFFWDKVVIPGKDAVPAVYNDWTEHRLITPAKDAVPAKVNHVTATRDGNVLVDTDFSTSFSQTWASPDKTVDHAYTVVVTAWDDARYNVNFSQTVKACEEPPVQPQTCSASGTWYSEDNAPIQGEDGLVFNGGSGKAVDAYFPATGNLQGFGDQSLTFANVAGYQPSFTIVLNRNGNSGYANLVAEWYMNGGSASTDGTFTVTPASLFWTNKIASGAGSQSDPQPLAFFSNLWPSNQLISFGPHLGSTADSDTHSTVTSISGCANVGFVPTKPEPTTRTVTRVVPDCEAGTTTVYTDTYTTEPVFQDGKWVAGEETGPVTTSETRDATVEECPPTVVTEVEPPVATDSCGTTDDSVTVPQGEGWLSTLNWNRGHTTATVTYRPAPGFVFAEGLQTSWTFNFDTTPCKTNPPTPTPTPTTPVTVAGDTTTPPSADVLAHTGSDIEGEAWAAGIIALALAAAGIILLTVRRKKVTEK